jgi:excisionase family DNA binding protein
MDELLTVSEVAEMLKVNQQTVRNWIDRGELSAVRVGSRRVRVKESDLYAFLAAGQDQAEADEQELRADFAASLERVQVDAADAELAVSLLSLAQAATRLARAIERR